MTAERTVELCFGDAARATATHTNLSGMRSDGPVLWVAGGETAILERLVADDAGSPRRYVDQTGFRLADLVTLPGPYADEKADIEGLARHGHFLWAVGSHSLRRRIKAKHAGEAALRRLSRSPARPTARCSPASPCARSTACRPSPRKSSSAMFRIGPRPSVPMAATSG